ncbi:MAG TPA: G/U mismatch-specific DNA glycosylase [Kofleriaceae bacterium]
MAKDRHPIAAAGKRLPPAQLEAALRRRVPDVIGPGLRILFCGINPGLYSAAAGHHFAGPGNRFWSSLHEAGFTSTLLRPEDEAELLALGLGITNLVPRTTPKAEVLSKRELRLGARRLLRKTLDYRPRILAVLGLGAYRAAFDDPAAVVGLQPRTIGPTQIWLLPNPSGLNAHHSNAELVELFRSLRRFERHR